MRPSQWVDRGGSDVRSGSGPKATPRCDRAGVFFVAGLVHRGDGMNRFTRRRLLERGALGAGALAVGARWPAAGARAAAGPGLPTAGQLRADVQRMVDFGPRLTGNDAHNGFIDWLESEYARAGLRVLPCDTFQTSRWEVGTFGLDVLEGSGAGPVKVATYFPRSRETPAAGVRGPLVDAGTPPQPSFNVGEDASLAAGIQRWPADVASWAQALPGTLSGSPQGAILLVDVPAPPPITPGIFAPLLTYYHDDKETEADLLAADYKRLWTVPGLAMPLQPFAAMGAAGVVLIVDASYEALKGQYAPFEWQNEDVPAVYVDRDTGAKLRGLAAARPQARLTLTATRKTVPTPTVTAVLPGSSDECLIFNTHTDGQGFVEENGPVGFLSLARYFAGLPAGRRLKRTLVFANWPGHMSNDLPQAQGWIDAHPDYVKKAAAALTVEHLGCTEWNDSTATGYHATGRAELFAVWVSQGPMADTVQAATVKHDLPRTALLRPPVQFGVGGPFEEAGIPELAAIAGPEYLLTISPSGEMEKFDPQLMAKQVAWLATTATELDKIDAAALKSGDPTLGSPSSSGNIEPSSAKPTEETCAPTTITTTVPVAAGIGPHAGQTRLTLQWYGRRHKPGGIVLVLHTDGSPLRDISVELRRGAHTLARRRGLTITKRRRTLVLKRPGGHRWPDGRYTLVVRRAGKVLVRRTVSAP